MVIVLGIFSNLSLLPNGSFPKYPLCRVLWKRIVRRLSAPFFFDPVVSHPCRKKDGINLVTNFLGHYKFLDWFQRWVKLLWVRTQSKNASITETRWILLYHQNQFFILQWLLLIWCAQRRKYTTKVHLVVWIYNRNNVYWDDSHRQYIIKSIFSRLE